VTTPARSQALPDVPSIAEFVPGYKAQSLFGIGAPRGTPPEIVATLNREINVVLRDPKIEARFVELGGTVHASSAAEFGEFLTAETAKWRKVIEAAGIKTE
jgi:tripartite-type tricarboxylate transporter receptor subunit TctC